MGYFELNLINLKKALSVIDYTIENDSIINNLGIDTGFKIIGYALAKKIKQSGGWFTIVFDKGLRIHIVNNDLLFIGSDDLYFQLKRIIYAE